jgi:hypothetical protein
MFVHVIIIKLKTELVCCVWQLWVFPKASWIWWFWVRYQTDFFVVGI